MILNWLMSSGLTTSIDVIPETAVGSPKREAAKRSIKVALIVYILGDEFLASSFFASVAAESSME